MNKNLITTGRAFALFLTANLLSAGVALAQSSSPEVFERVDKNIQNAQANRADSTKNLGLVTENLTQVQKARSTVQADASKIRSELAANQKIQKEIEGHLDKFRKSEDQEKKSIQSEEKKIADLEKSIQTLRNSIEKRRENLNHISAEREKVTTAHADWKSRTDQLVKLQAEAKVRDDRLAVEEKEWRGKKSKYEKDSSRWTTTLAEQEKVKKNLVTLQGR